MKWNEIRLRFDDGTYNDVKEQSKQYGMSMTVFCKMAILQLVKGNKVLRDAETFKELLKDVQKILISQSEISQSEVKEGEPRAET